MAVQPTSRWAYEEVDLSARQSDVIRALDELGEASDQEIAAYLKWTINRVTPRRGELVALGVVARARLKAGPFGHKVSVWRLEPVQLDLALGLERTGDRGRKPEGARR